MVDDRLCEGGCRRGERPNVATAASSSLESGVQFQVVDDGWNGELRNPRNIFIESCNHEKIRWLLSPTQGLQSPASITSPTSRGTVARTSRGCRFYRMGSSGRTM